jgi:hypothetical protein
MNNSQEPKAPIPTLFAGDASHPPISGLREQAAKIRAWLLARMFGRRQPEAVTAGPASKWFNWRKWIHNLHRDLGYLFFGTTMVYASSGLFLNHRNQWPLTFETISQHKLAVTAPGRDKAFTFQDATNLLARAGVNGNYLSHDVLADGVVRITFQGGSAELNQDSGRMVIKTIRHRPLPFILTYIQLHFNPGSWWTWFSDTYCAALMIMAVSGMFILRGRHGILGRGGLLVLIGIAVPAIFARFHL